MSGDPEPYHISFTIAAAARHCGVARRTLQRAITSGRLSLTPDHRLTLAALAQAGYSPATDRSDTAAMHHRDTPQALSQLMAPLIARLDRLISLLETQHGTPTPQRRTAATRHSDSPGAPQRQPPHRMPQEGSQDQGYDTSKFVLGRLCPRGHDYDGTGRTLRKHHSGTCMACEREQQRERRRARRQHG
jgi:hypothetical protein